MGQSKPPTLPFQKGANVSKFGYYVDAFLDAGASMSGLALSILCRQFGINDFLDNVSAIRMLVAAIYETKC